MLIAFLYAEASEQMRTATPGKRRLRAARVRDDARARRTARAHFP
jgi:hypothetical protein